MRHVSLSILMPLFSKANETPSSPPPFTISDFSRPDLSELLAHEEEICPLVEAEVYVIYGRVADAEEALAALATCGSVGSMYTTMVGSTSPGPGS